MASKQGLQGLPPDRPSQSTMERKAKDGISIKAKKNGTANVKIHVEKMVVNKPQPGRYQ